MSHSRSVPPAPAEASTAWKLPTLRERLERARQPGASMSDVDLLVAGLAPDAVTEELEPRERADLLLDILDDKSLSRRKDHQGRQVRHVAARALLALGYPYALELPPGAMPPTEHAPRPSASEPSPEREPLTRWNWVGLLLVLAVSGVEWMLIHRTFFPPPAPTPPPSCNLCRDTSDVSLSSMLFAVFGIFGNMLLLPLSGLVQGVTTLLAWTQRQRCLLRKNAQVLWAGGAMRGGLSVILCCVSAARPPSEGSYGYALGNLLLVTGTLLGLAGFCFRSYPDEDLSEYATESSPAESAEPSAQEPSEYADEEPAEAAPAYATEDA